MKTWSNVVCLVGGSRSWKQATPERPDPLPADPTPWHERAARWVRGRMFMMFFF